MFNVYFVTCPKCGCFYGTGTHPGDLSLEEIAQDCPEKESHPERRDGEVVLGKNPKNLEAEVTLMSQNLRRMVPHKGDFMEVSERLLGKHGDFLDDLTEREITIDEDVPEDMKDQLVDFHRDLRREIEDYSLHPIEVGTIEENGEKLFGLFRKESV